MNFENIILEEEQKDLFIRIAGIIKSVPRENRSSMIEANSFDGTSLIMPTNKPEQSAIKGFARGDLDILADAGLLRMEFGSKGSKKFTVTPEGFKYYEWILKKQKKSAKRAEKKTFNLPDLDQFSITLRDVLTKINNLKKEADALSPVKEEYKERFEKKIRLEWNYHSNKLEGNELNYGETRELLYYDKTSGKSHKDHREIKGHDEAITYIEDIIENGDPFTEKFIRELNKKVLKDPYKKEAVTPDGKPTVKIIYPGQYKTTPNHVKTKSGDIFKFAEPHEVPQKMEELITWYREENSYPLIKAGELHYRFVNIHPFDDGNGRVARLLMNYCLMEYGFPPVVIKTEQKDEYHSCLRKADAGNFNPFFIFLGECLLYSLELFTSAAKGKDINEYSDLDKRLKVFYKKLSQDGKDEIRLKRSKELISERFEDSIWPFFESLIENTKKFYGLFADHEFNYMIDRTHFSGNYDIPEIKEKLREAVAQNEQLRELGIEIRLLAFKKVPENPMSTYPKTNVEFQDHLYIINPEHNGNKKLPEIRKLYDQPVTEEEITDYVNKDGTSIMDHLESYYNSFNQEKTTK